jgi:Tfp pilus assembly protein PilF
VTTNGVLHHAGVEDPTALRLNGWKEIAAYLGRGERTVKRWEAERELPVRRLPGGGRASVHAYTNELEHWLQSNRGPIAREEQDAPEPGLAMLEERSDESQAPSGVFLPVPVASAASRTGWERWGRAAGVLVVAGFVLAFSLVAWKLTRRPVAVTASVVTGAKRTVAHDLYLKGRFEWSRRTPESLERALDDFTQSIVHDPANAPAYSGLADTYMLLHEYSVMNDIEAYRRARAAAEKAVALDDSLAEAHRSMGFVEAWGNWDFGAAAKEFRRAIELDPRDPLTHLWFATALKVPGWSATADREFNRAQELDASSSIVLANKSIWLYESGRTQAGLELARQVEHDDPDFIPTHRYLASMGWHARDYPSFLSESALTANLTKDGVLAKIAREANAGYQQGGERGLLQRLYDVQNELYRAGELPGEPLAITCLRLGKKEEAVILLEDDFAHHRASALSALTDSEFGVLASDPRFREMVSELHMPKPPDTDAQ